MSGGGDPSRPEHGGDIEEQDIPESHLATQLCDDFFVRMGQGSEPPIGEKENPGAALRDRDSKYQILQTYRDYRRNKYSAPPVMPNAPTSKINGSEEAV